MQNFEQVFAQYYPQVYRFTLALCQNAAMAEELAQHTFYQALIHIERFRGECRLDVWLCQIAKHAYYKDHRRIKKNAEAAYESLATAQREPDATLDVERMEDMRQVHRALHDLSEPYKEVFSLRVFGELPFAEIGELFQKTESWARVTFYRAKLKIQEQVLRAKEDQP